MKLLLFLTVVSLGFCCFQIDSGSVQVQQCDDTSGELLCNYITVTNLILPVQTGSCAQLQLVGGSYSNTLVFPDGQVTFTLSVIDIYLNVNLDGVGYCADVESFVDIECNCVAASQRCWHDLISPTCKSENHCPNYDVNSAFAQTSFCFQAHGGDSSSCTANDPFWCGCAFDAQNGNYYIFANLADYSVYATMQMTVNDSRQTYASQQVTFLLQGLNTYELDVNSYTLKMAIESFSLPNPSLASQGLFVADISPSTSVPYVVPGIAPLGSVAQATSPCYYRSVDLQTWSYDQTSFDAALQCGTAQTVKCSSNEANCQLNTGKLWPLLVNENSVAERVDPFYVYRDRVIGTSSRLRFNLAQELSLNMQVTSTAANVRSIISQAIAKLSSAGSHSICLFGTKVLWAAGQNLGPSGQGLGILVASNISYVLGNVLVPQGAFNLTWTMPVYQEGLQICLDTLISSCVDFNPTCESEIIPQNPSTNNNGRGSSAVSGQWWFILLIVVVAVIGFCLLMLVCICCLKLI